MGDGGARSIYNAESTAESAQFANSPSPIRSGRFSALRCSIYELLLFAYIICIVWFEKALRQNESFRKCIVPLLSSDRSF